MAVAFDAYTNSGVQATGTLSFVHTPVSTPRGVIVKVTNGAGGFNKVISVTYGGIGMADVSGSPNIHLTGELGTVSCYFLNAFIPTGAQTVVVTTASSAHTADCITLTAGQDTEIVDFDFSINSDSLANPSGTLQLGGVNCFCALAFVSGQNAVTGTTQLSGWTLRNEEDLGTVVRGCYTYDTIGTADVTFGFTQTAEDAVIFAIAVREAAAPAPVVHAVQTTAKSRQAAVTTLNASFVVLPTVGDLLVLQVSGWRTTNFAVTTVVDNQTGNTWTRALQGPLAGGARSEWWWCKVVGSTGTFTVTVNTASSSTIVFSVTQVTGFTDPIVDQTITNTEAAIDNTPNSGTTSTTTAAVEFIVAGTCADTGGAYNYSRAVPGSVPVQGWTSCLQESDSNNFQACDFAYAVTTATAAMLHNWLATGSSGWVSGMVTFKENVVAAAILPPFRTNIVRLVK